MSDRALKAKYIGNKIKELREGIGQSQSGLSKETKLSRAAISLIEKGERYPSLIVLKKLTSTLKVSIEELTGESTPTSSEINQEAMAFFRNWSALDDISESDKKVIRNLVSHFREKKDEERGE